MKNFNQRYQALNLPINTSNTPIANYQPFKKIGNTIYIAGQLPWQGTTLIQGKAGLNATLEEAIFAARLCAVQVIHQLYLACDQNLNLVKECISLKGYVNCTPDFTNISEVINGASDLMVELFGQAGKHTRVAIGINSLPKGSLVEIEAVFCLTS
jgi:enamine deaminase RidA (YjgF/YER057c/UK114 family)